MIVGSFYFRRTDNGNLIGEFINHESRRSATESADLIGEESDNFVGIYDSTWFDGEAQTMRLSIIRKERTINIFSLQWSLNGQPNFIGEGFLNDGVLTGMYCDIELNDRIGNII